jgi:predicted phosphodiesterase
MQARKLTVLQPGHENDYARIVLLGDPHLPGRLLEKKRQLIADINSWPDVSLVVALGDICAGQACV